MAAAEVKPQPQVFQVLVYQGYPSPGPPRLTQVGGGYSSGWTEQRRNEFTIGTLVSVLTREFRLSLYVELAEFAMHWMDGFRETAASQIQCTGEIVSQACCRDYLQRIGDRLLATYPWLALATKALGNQPEVIEFSGGHRHIEYKDALKLGCDGVNAAITRIFAATHFTITQNGEPVLVRYEP